VAEQTAFAGTHDTGGVKPDRAVVRDALAVGVAVGLSGFAFGVTSAGSGLSLPQTCALSLLVFTGASQFALVGALAAGGNPFTAAAGAFFLGVRNAFYGLRLSQLLALPRAVRPFAAQWVIDETTVVALAQPTRRAARIGFTVTGLSLYLLWNLTTLLARSARRPSATPRHGDSTRPGQLSSWHSSRPCSRPPGNGPWPASRSSWGSASCPSCPQECRYSWPRQPLPSSSGRRGAARPATGRPATAR
jgi:hypothetical protein